MNREAYSARSSGEERVRAEHGVVSRVEAVPGSREGEDAERVVRRGQTLVDALAQPSSGRHVPAVDHHLQTRSSL